MEKKCYKCENTTNQKLDDMDEIGWNAFRVGNEKAICFCPDCYDVEEVCRLISNKLGPARKG